MPFIVYKYRQVQSWEATQPPSYKALHGRLRNKPTLSGLKILGKKVFETGKLDRGQNGVFWFEYNKRRSFLHGVIARNCGDTARGLLNIIRTASGKELSAFGPLLYKMHKGTVRLDSTPTPDEWEFIWATYKLKKNQ